MNFFINCIIGILSVTMVLLKCPGTSGFQPIIMVPKRILEVPVNVKKEFTPVEKILSKNFNIDFFLLSIISIKFKNKSRAIVIEG